MIQGGNHRSRSIQTECSMPTAIDIMINFGLGIHQYSTFIAKKSFLIKAIYIYIKTISIYIKTLYIYIYIYIYMYVCIYIYIYIYIYIEREIVYLLSGICLRGKSVPKSVFK